MTSTPTTMNEWLAFAQGLLLRCDPYVDGRFIPSTDADTFEATNPATGGSLCRLPAGSAADVDNAVLAARNAVADRRWYGLPLTERKLVMLRLADIIDAHADEFAALQALEVGKVVTAARSELDMATGFFRYYAEALDKIYGEVAPTDGSLFAYSSFEPYGVVAAIVPWNFPLANLAYKVAPALAAGNCVVLKPSELSSLSALRFAELAGEAGLPDGVLNVVPGLGDTVGTALGRHHGVDFLTFTGSTATGRRLMQLAGESNGKPLMLECGGKSAQIICGDMADDVDRLAERVVHDAFWNQGQWCSARSRLIVETPLYDRLIEAVANAAGRVAPGHPFDPEARYGTIASQQQFDRIQRATRAALNDGTNVVLLGSTGDPCKLSMTPTIFGDVDPTAAIAQEEVFGPVLCAFRAKDFDEALAMANDSAFGLAGTVWTRDARKLTRAMRDLRAGRIAIRTDVACQGSAGMALAAEPLGASGFGVEKGLEGFRSYCRMRAVEIF